MCTAAVSLPSPLYGELNHCLMGSRVSESVSAHTRAIPGRKNRCSHADRVEEATCTLITSDSWPQGQETVPGTSVLLSTGMVFPSKLLFSVFLLYSASVEQSRFRQVHTHADLLGGSIPDVIHSALRLKFTSRENKKSKEERKRERERWRSSGGSQMSIPPWVPIQRNECPRNILAQ